MMYVHKDSRYVHKTARSGFTLIEIMVAIAIVGIMLAIVVPGFMKMYRGAQRKTAKQSLKMMQSAINLFVLDVGKEPEQLNDLVRRPAPSPYYEEDMIDEWNPEGYLSTNKVPLDPWKSKFQYRLTLGGKHRYELYSYGPSRRGAPKAEWIRVWGR